MLLPAGANCQIQVALAPKAAGDRTAALVVTDSLNAVTTVPLALLAQPSVVSASPVAGLPAGGTSVTVHGAEFTGVTGVSFGTEPATYTVDSATQIAARSPSGTLGSTVDVTVTNAHGASGPDTADQFTYANPPDAPTGASATAGVRAATVRFAGPSHNGGTPITAYTVTASPGGAMRPVPEVRSRSPGSATAPPIPSRSRRPTSSAPHPPRSRARSRP